MAECTPAWGSGEGRPELVLLVCTAFPSPIKLLPQPRSFSLLPFPFSPQPRWGETMAASPEDWTTHRTPEQATNNGGRHSKRDPVSRSRWEPDCGKAGAGSRRAGALSLRDGFTGNGGWYQGVTTLNLGLITNKTAQFSNKLQPAKASSNQGSTDKRVTGGSCRKPCLTLALVRPWAEHGSGLGSLGLG